ncbi:hypothetical protein BH11ARM2_BH11ARM2_17950 [soil metagenome]
MNSIEVERNASRSALFAVALAAAGLTATETLAIAVNRVVPSDGFRLFALKATSWPLFLVGALVGYVSRGAGARSPLIVATSVALVFTLAKRFRGNWIWAGTFRDYLDSPAPWLFVLGLGCVVGILPWTRRTATAPSSLASVICLAGAAFAAWAVGILWPLDSEFPQTRYLAVSALACVVGILAWRIEL